MSPATVDLSNKLLGGLGVGLGIPRNLLRRCEVGATRHFPEFWDFTKNRRGGKYRRQRLSLSHYSFDFRVLAVNFLTLDAQLSSCACPLLLSCFNCYD